MRCWPRLCSPPSLLPGDGVRDRQRRPRMERHLAGVVGAGHESSADGGRPGLVVVHGTAPAVRSAARRRPGGTVRAHHPARPGRRQDPGRPAGPRPGRGRAPPPDRRQRAVRVAAVHAARRRRGTRGAGDRPVSATASPNCRAAADGTFTDAAQTDPVAVAVDHARTELHAERVVVAGASMGGSVALMSAATLPGVDAAVDLSGPVEWEGMEVVRRGRALDVPVLVAMATSEGPEEAAGAQEIVANAPARQRPRRPLTRGTATPCSTTRRAHVLPLDARRGPLDQAPRLSHRRRRLSRRRSGSRA